jgi:hypothetical protein
MDFETLTAVDPAAVGRHSVKAFAVGCCVWEKRRRAPVQRSRLSATDGGPDSDA